MHIEMLRRVGALALAALLGGCNPEIYRPTANTVPDLGLQQSKNLFASAWSQSLRGSACLPQKAGDVRRVTEHGFLTHRSGKVSACRWSDVPDIVVKSLLPCNAYVIACTSEVAAFDREATAIDAANALYVLKYRLFREAREDFVSTALEYRAASPKPQVPEEARRFKVQAESAIRDKRFAEALVHYGAALAVAPWWPEGHFNSAVILAELGDYGAATREMTRYLELVPDAADARQARDRIYEWDGKHSAQWGAP